MKTTGFEFFPCHDRSHALGLLLQKVAQAFHAVTKQLPHFVCAHAEDIALIQELYCMYRGKSIELSLLKAAPDTSTITAQQIERELKPNTALILLSYQNVYTGALQPLESIFHVAKEHRVPLHVDFDTAPVQWDCVNSASAAHSRQYWLCMETRLVNGYCLREFSPIFTGPPPDAKKNVKLALALGKRTSPGGVAEFLKVFDKKQPPGWRVLETNCCDRLWLIGPFEPKGKHIVVHAKHTFALGNSGAEFQPVAHLPPGYTVIFKPGASKGDIAAFVNSLMKPARR